MANETLYKHATQYVCKLRAIRMREAGLEFESHVKAGAVAQTIAHLAKSHNGTRIVMGTRGLGALGNLVLGSIACKVVQLAPVPVTLVE